MLRKMALQRLKVCNYWRWLAGWEIRLVNVIWAKATRAGRELYRGRPAFCTFSALRGEMGFSGGMHFIGRVKPSAVAETRRARMLLFCIGYMRRQRRARKPPRRNMAATLFLKRGTAWPANAASGSTNWPCGGWRHRHRHNPSCPTPSRAAGHCSFAVVACGARFGGETMAPGHDIACHRSRGILVRRPVDDTQHV